MFKYVLLQGFCSWIVAYFKITLVRLHFSRFNEWLSFSFFTIIIEMNIYIKNREKMPFSI